MPRGSQLLQVLLRLHFLPLGVTVHQLDEAATVGVHVVLVEPLPPLRLSHHLHNLSSGRGELVVDVEGEVGEVVAGLGVATGHEARGELLPGAVLVAVPDADDEGGVGGRPLLAQGVAGGHVLQGDPDASFGLNGPDSMALTRF